MTAKHNVKINGVWHRAGSNISAIVIPEKDGMEPDKPRYNKTEINRMSTAQLQQLAGEQGIDGAEEITGAELKKILIEKFGL